ncbi:DUF378 domain-containing protein [Sebaldella sp. S0638]|uniref:DUF378 domain-containing protein n=1 Tax=Sebaldella sp. S0638 TaxID=2957809 RepID=UPI0020A0A939|nr:DUF378 domain-containing protein [Sebaldella sp. S0638]MCP1223295.1 DUF378 domain-containing protein [Sebaldella sp. S0638]
MKTSKKNLIISAVLIFSALNWGIVGVFGFDLIEVLFGWFSNYSRLIYVCIGITGIYCIKYLME